MGLFDGYQRGAEAAKADCGENKLALRALQEFAKNGFGLIPGAQNREDEFRRGYSETVETLTRDAQRNVPVYGAPPSTSTSTQSTQGASTSMATNKNIQSSIDLLKEMGRHVFYLKESLREAIDTYDKNIKEMEGRGMDETVTQFYDLHVLPLCKQLRLAEKGLDDEALKSLKSVIESLNNIPKV